MRLQEKGEQSWPRSFYRSANGREKAKPGRAAANIDFWNHERKINSTCGGTNSLRKIICHIQLNCVQHGPKHVAFEGQ